MIAGEGATSAATRGAASAAGDVAVAASATATAAAIGVGSTVAVASSSKGTAAGIDDVALLAAGPYNCLNDSCVVLNESQTL